MLALPITLVVPDSANLLLRLLTEESGESDSREWEYVREPDDGCTESEFIGGGKSMEREVGETDKVGVFESCSLPFGKEDESQSLPSSPSLPS